MECFKDALLADDPASTSSFPTSRPKKVDDKREKTRDAAAGGATAPAFSTFQKPQLTAQKTILLSPLDSPVDKGSVTALQQILLEV